MTNKLKRGFTLIEIVIVLAIAALILVVVFIAVQGAQRGQRNDARRALASRTLSAMNDFRANNGGTFTAATFATAVNTNGQYLTTNDRTVGGDVFAVTNDPALTTTTPANGAACDIQTVAAPPALTWNATVRFNLDATANPNRDVVAVCIESGAAAAAQSGIVYKLTN